MKYVLRVDHVGKVLLHNVVTGRLVVLDDAEAEALERLPMAYSLVIEQLVTEHYLVPVEFDEHDCVSGMRTALRKLADVQQGSDLTFYTILPTTACNARCYYCFEKDVEVSTMTSETADDVVQFIVSHCNGKNVWLKWFGGEPTVAANRISQICSGLKQRGITFSSIMTTNGYLFDEAMAYEAKHVWNLVQITLSMDGTGENYNRIKDYVNPGDNPYERVLRNVGLLMKHGIRVHARMNFDQTNVNDFSNWLSDLSERYPHEPLLEARAHYINDVQIVDGLPRYHGDTMWYNEKILELHRMSQSLGLLKKNEHLPCLSYNWCPASSLRSVTITPQGKLVSCYEMLEDDEFKGNLKDGITKPEIVKGWLKYANTVECENCPLFPNCGKIDKCPRKHKCYQKAELLYDSKVCMINSYNSFNT
jgi:radical SAM protein with 4Fe4S-binding SPASM domain